MKKQLRSTSVLFGIILGIICGTAMASVPFLFDAVHYKNPIIAIAACLYFFVVIGLSLSAIIRVAGALLSQHIRSLIIRHPIMHAFWLALGFGIIAGILIIMLLAPMKSTG